MPHTAKTKKGQIRSGVIKILLYSGEAKFLFSIADLFSPFINQLYELAYQFEYSYMVNHDKYVRHFGNHAAYPSEIVKERIDCCQLKSD